MRRFVLLLLIAVVLVSFSGCSAVRDILGDEKYDKLTGKLSAVWDGVAKDALASVTDDAWREFGFGKSLDWPEDRIASSLPKLRDGRTEYSFSADDGGYIRLSGISDAELDEYIAQLAKIGYKKTVQTPPFDVLVTFDNTYIGFIRSSDGDCSMVYADSFSRLGEILSLSEEK